LRRACSLDDGTVLAQARLIMPRLATTSVVEWNDGEPNSRVDDLAGEDPLEIRLDDEPVGLTMRTAGHDDELAVGYLFAEGLIDTGSRVLFVESAAGIARVHVDGACPVDHPSSRRHLNATSACGVCGRASLEALRNAGLSRPANQLSVSPPHLCDWPGRVRQAQAIFDRTGGLHAAGLFGARNELLAVREDIGRHNAVDKAVGWAVLNGRMPLSGCGLLVSGRGGFEIVQKAVAAGVELVACVSAPSSLAVQLAREFGLTLVGFLRNRRFVVYAGADRIRPA
jgi:FdhD protein